VVERSFAWATRFRRLAKDYERLPETVAELQGRGVGFRSLTEQIDTTTPGGKLVFHVFGALAEFERDLIRDRTQAGLAAARARGCKGGRPKKLADPKTVALARELHAAGQTDVATICKTLGISRATLFRYLPPAQKVPAPTFW
jgi:DNA invertase Pin-like site-specific DNA recombinase